MKDVYHMNPERPTSGDLKSGDSLFSTTPAPSNVNRPLVFSVFFCRKVGYGSITVKICWINSFNLRCLITFRFAEDKRVKLLGKPWLEFFDVLKSRVQSLLRFKKFHDCVYELQFLHFIYQTPNIPIVGLLMTYKTAADNSFFPLRDSFVFHCGKWDVEKQMNRLLWALILRSEPQAQL